MKEYLKDHYVTYFYCNNHSRYFSDRYDYTQHLTSFAHESDYEHLYCEDHDRYYYEYDEFINHMTSRSHEYDGYYCYEHYSYFFSVDDFINHIRSGIDYNFPYYLRKPKNVTTRGYWIYRTDFIGKKSYGFFLCVCGSSWTSAHSYKKYRQGCENCEHYNYALCFWENEEKKDKNKTYFRDDDGPHDKLRCEACQYGDCI